MRWFVLAVVVATIAVATCLVWVVAQLGGAEVTKAADDIYSVLVPCAAAVACWLAARRRQGRGRLGWALVGVSAFSWGMGSVAWTYYDVVARIPVPFPSYADAGFLIAIPLAFVGLASFPGSPKSATSRLRTLLEGSLIASGLLYLSWVTALGGTYAASTGSLAEKAIGLAYPVGDVVMGSIVLLLLPRSNRENRLPLLLVGCGILANTVSDSVFTYLQLDNSYNAISNVVDAGWILGFAMIALGALWEAGHAEGAAPAEPRMTLVSTLMPYGPAMLAGALAILQQATTGAQEPFLFWDGVVILVLLLARQLLTLLENLALNHSLEQKVEARTVELQRREQRFRSLVQNSSDAIIIVNASHAIQYLSPAVEHLFGHPATSLESHQLDDLLEPADRERLSVLLNTLATSPRQTAQVEARVRHLDGSSRSCEMTISNLLADAAVSGLVINTRDITDRKALEEQLSHQAFHDSLTGLANRALFQDRLRQTLARAARRQEKPAVLFLDLDRFKNINDGLGHGAGDELLAEVARRLETTVRLGDTMARLGGDEFGVLLEDTQDGTAAIAVAERIIEALKAPFELGAREVFISASIGIAYLSGEDDAAALLRNADIAMYMAKAQGKGRYAVFNPTMHDELITQLQLEADLQRAIDRQEFFLVYQPLVSLNTGRTIGLEALVRWRHPERGVVPPLSFIPIAEKTGAIVALGRQVLRDACQQVQAWRATHPELELSVNVSGRQLKDPGFVHDVEQALWDSHLPAPVLTLEMTESVVMEDVEATLTVLNALHALGVRLAIDDFGTGYSSLSYLRRFPVDSLKIDRSFVSGLSGSEHEPLVTSIMQLAGALKLEVVAEGIERPEQLNELRELGCLVGQGFLFSKPTELDAMTVYLAEDAVAQAA